MARMPGIAWRRRDGIAITRGRIVEKSRTAFCENEGQDAGSAHINFVMKQALP